MDWSENTYTPKEQFVETQPDVTVAEAKNHLPKLIHNSEMHGIIPISRHGKVVAYIVSERDFRKLTQSTNGFLDKLKSFREKHNFTEEDIWSNVRSKEIGREIAL